MKEGQMFSLTNDRDLGFVLSQTSLQGKSEGQARNLQELTG